MATDILKRIKQMSKRNGDCVEWQGHKTQDGYGVIKISGKSHLVHRVIWEYYNGCIPDAMYICHKCDNPTCCKLSHLFIGTPSDNQHDSYNKGRHPIISNKGECNGRNILTESNVRALRRHWNNGKFKYGKKKEFFEKYSGIYGVSISTIEKVVKKHSWKHLRIESE